jgi:hypothetical protein
VHRGRGKGIELRVEGGMHRHELALEMGGQLGDRQALVGQQAGDLVAIGLAFRRQVQIEQALVPTGNLHALVAKLGHIAADRVQAVERRGIGRELGQEHARSLDGLHGQSLLETVCVRQSGEPSRRPRGWLPQRWR